MTNKFNEKTDVFRELGPCLEYIYKNFGREVFFSGRLSAHVLDLGPSIEEYSVIRFLEEKNILNQIETIGSLDINDRNLLVNDIIYKLPIQLNKDAFRNTLEIIILSLGIDLDENKNSKIFETPPSEFDFDKNTGTIVKYLGINEEIIIPKEIDGEQVKIIGDSSFRDRFINKITLPDGVVSIGEYAFYNNKIENLYLPESLKSIGGNAFSCNQINELNLPDGVVSIGDNAFFKNKIEKLHLPESLKSIEYASFWNNQISELNLPDGVVSIGEYAFFYNKIEKLHLPESLKSISDFAFRYNQISELNLPDGVVSIGDGAFVDNNIKEVYLPESIYKFDSIAFDHDVKINKITTLNTYTNNSHNVNSSANLKPKTQNSNMFDDDIEPLDEESKQSLNELLNNHVYAGDEKILENNWGKQNKDTEISETPPSEFAFDKNAGTIVKYLGASKEITIPKRIQGVPVKFIGPYSFRDIGIEKINIPFGIEGIGAWAFFKNKIKVINIPDSVISIGEGAFAANQIKKLTLGQNIELIDDFTFFNNKIETLNIPGSVISIGEGAFTNNQIDKLILGENIENIRNSTFAINKIESLELPNSIKTIEADAFRFNEIRILKLPNSIKSIGAHAFSDNNIIEILDLPESLKSLGDSAFQLNNLKEVFLPESIYKFGSGAFDPDVKIKKK